MARGNTQPSLLRMMQSRFLSQIKQANAAREELEAYESTLDKYTPKNEDPHWVALRAKERLTRGIVRGSAQMLIIVSNPAEAKDNDAIGDLEYDSGLKGVERSKPRPKASEFSKAFLDRYYGRNEA